MRAPVAIHALASERGAAALELAIVAPVFFTLLLGIFYVSMTLWAYTSIQHAADEAARCASVMTTVCKDASTTQTYASNHYRGPGTPRFTYSTAGCGNTVTGLLTFSWGIPLLNTSIPLSAAACFP